MQKDVTADGRPELDFRWPIVRDVGLSAPLR